jgi:hypothetical protein
MAESSKENDQKDALASATAISTNQWFLTSLTALGHPQPTLFQEALSMESGEGPLIQLTLWLEDCIIRLWTLEQRDKLKAEYWKTISVYLEELQCPKAYYTPEHWQLNPALRIRVIFWLLSVATSELYGDAFLNEGEAMDDDDDDDDAPSHSPNTPEPSTKSNESNANFSLEHVSESDLAALDTTRFPLGFTTGDNQVDGILTLLRMNMLLKLEQEQQYVNHRIAQLQATTVPGAKPLKKYKPKIRENKFK